MIEFEIQRHDDRVKTLLTLQGLLFAAIGFSWGKSHALLIIFSLVGLFSTIASTGHLHKALIAIAWLESEWKKKLTKESKYSGPPLMGFKSYKDMKILGLFHASYVFSISFAFAWSGILTAAVYLLLAPA
jgi:hypothetical protein